MKRALPELADVFRREYPRLVRALGAAAGRDAAADAVQDAFVQAARHWRRIRDYDDPAAWIRRVAVNRLADQRRAARREAGALPQIVIVNVTEPARPPSDVVRLVAGLPRGQRLAVCLFYLADLSIAEVAEALGVSAGTVKSQLHDARMALRSQMETIDDA
jgi:RNA polymerase sigma-70 factor (ECF subfamily)